MASIALSPDDAYSLKKAGKIAAFIGVENGYPIGKDLSRIKEFYNRGARYITLAHTRNNDICDSSTDSAGPEHNGLSAFGRDVISEMNRTGMIIDVSHISDKAFWDVLNLSKAPVIASHSSCRALCESPRNLSDDMLLALRDNMGVIQILHTERLYKDTRSQSRTGCKNCCAQGKIRRLSETFGKGEGGIQGGTLGYKGKVQKTCNGKRCCRSY